MRDSIRDAGPRQLAIFALLAIAVVGCIASLSADKGQIRTIAQLIAVLCYVGVAVLSRGTKPYHRARSFFWLAFCLSWIIGWTAKDHTLRRGGMICGVLASIGSLIALELQSRATKKQEEAG